MPGILSMECGGQATGIIAIALACTVDDVTCVSLSIKSILDGAGRCQFCQEYEPNCNVYDAK